jgi:hypothetical protein
MGTPPSEFNLVFNGKQLDLYHTISQFGVKNSDTLHMVQNIFHCIFSTCFIGCYYLKTVVEH